MPDPLSLTPPPRVAEVYNLDAQARLGLLRAPHRLVTQDFVGNYLELRYGDRDSGVFIDDRTDMFPTEVIDDALALIRADARWQTVLDTREIDTALWERGQPLALLLAQSPEWRLTYADEDWVVYQRR